MPIEQLSQQSKTSYLAQQTRKQQVIEIKSDDPRVKAEAVALARQQQEIELKQQRSQEQITIQELEEQ
ncbi:MAG: hypothetical protein ACPGSN_08845, partial [Psychrobium sp.]